MPKSLPYHHSMEQLPVSLSIAPVGVRLNLAARGSTGRCCAGVQGRRLAQLGLRAGAEFVVVMRTSGGGRVIAVAGSRIALDRMTAQELQVTIPEQICDTVGTVTAIGGVGSTTSAPAAVSVPMAV